MFMNFLPRDTTPEAARHYYATLRKLSPSQRLKMAFELSDAVRETLIAGIRHRHPDYSPRQIRRELLRLTLDKELFAKVAAHLDLLPEEYFPEDTPPANRKDGRTGGTIC